MDILQIILKALPLDDIKKTVLRSLKELVEKTDNPIDDNFVMIMAKLFEVDYDEL